MVKRILFALQSKCLVLLFFGAVFLGPCLLLKGGTPLFSTLSMRDGLPSNIIAAIAQDKYGFMWIATGSGLARYDGYRFKIFKRTESENSLPSNELTSIINDGEFVWVGSWGGLCKINITTLEVTRIELGANRAIRTLYKGKNNVLWIGTGNGLIRYLPTDNTYQLFNEENSGLSHDVVRTIYEDSNGTLWVGTYDKLNKLVANSKRFVTLSLRGQHKPALTNHLILDIKATSKQSDSLLWVGTETGLYKLNTTDGTFIHYGENNPAFSNEVVKCIYSDEENQLWLGTDFGLNVFNPKTKSNALYFHNPQVTYSLANNVIWQIMEDTGGVIWFVTSNGLSRINKFGNFYEYIEISHPEKDQLIGNQVKSFLITSKGIYWLATQHGVIRIDPATNSRKVFNAEAPANNRILLNNVYALEEDNFGRIWIGTAGGINIWDETNAKMHAITANETNGLSSNYIGKFTKTPDGSLWVSAWEGGLYKIEGNLMQPETITFEPVQSLPSGSEKHVAGNNYIWVIDYDELYRVDPKNFTKTHIPSFSNASNNQMIYCVYFSRKGHLWAGTQNGLVQYKPGEDKAYLHSLQSANDVTLNSIIEDRDGNIWSSSNTSLQKFNPENQRLEIFPLDKNIPLKSFYYGCAARTASNEIIFGGDNGYIIFSPDKVKPNPFKPNIYLTALEINNKNISINEEINGEILLNKEVSFTGELTLNYDQRSVSFEFSSLHFWQPTMNTFAYKLEGFDEEWNYVSGDKNFAVYSNLPAGTYTFIVKGTNNYGIESDHMATLSLTINPPLFLRKGFIALYIGLVIGIIYYALKTYSTRVHLKNELKIIKMEKEHAEEIEQTKEQFFTNISHELRTPISLILPPIHEIQKKGNLDKESSILINLAEKNSIRLLKLLNQILDFNKLENDTLQINVANVELVGFCYEVFSLFTDQAHRNKIDFNFHAGEKEKTVWVDAEKIETVLFNLLSNAFKFTPIGGRIDLTTSVVHDLPGFTEGAFSIIVSDSGVGIPPEDKPKIFERFYQSPEGKKRDASSGIGLTLAAEYVRLHHGTISVESEVGKGTAFIIHLPLGKSHFPLDAIHEDDTISLLARRSVHPQRQDINSYQYGLESDKPLILIIEDNIDMITFVKSSLAHKYDFVIAEDGEEGLTKANNFIPQVIISDIMMPVMDGLTLCRKIKENPKTSHISIILLTAKSLNAQKVEGIRTGADVYITKPFEIDLLEAHIDHLIQRNKELVDYFRNELITQPHAANKNNNEDNKFIKQVMEIIEANIANPELSVELISEEIGISSTHLYRKLKSLTNYSAKDIIKKYRVKKASLLLKNKEGNISEIMYDVGFSSLSYFSKCFKAEFGLAPKDYQRKMNSTLLDIENEIGGQS